MGHVVKRRTRAWDNSGWSISFGNKTEKICSVAVVFHRNLPHNLGMKTRFRLPRLTGWTGRCSVALIALTFCASALADPSKNVVATSQPQLRKMQTEAQRLAFKKRVYIFISTSAIPQPIDRVAVPIPTTAI